MDMIGQSIILIRKHYFYNCSTIAAASRGNMIS